NGNTGLLVAPANVDALVSAIEKLLDNKMLREEMGKNGRLLVQNKFNLNNNVNEIITIYNQILKSNKN
nr:glycosyltransferase [Bacteroidota bacterium]